MGKILIACEYSGIVRDAFTRKGHDVISCDLLPTESEGKHYQGDVRDILYSEKWDIVIAHPPCTYMSNSGVRWLYNKDGSMNVKRWEELEKATDFFNVFVNLQTRRAIENPVMHKHALLRLDTGKPTQTIQPYQFGHLETKRTCLWLKGLEPLKETNNVYDEMMKLSYSQRAKVHHAAPSPDRWKIRSTTYTGIAEAFASQWG